MHSTTRFTQRRALLALPLLASASAQADRSQPADPYRLAIASFRAGRFPDAYGRFVALADRGDAEAARLALWMYQRGPSLFGSDWDATPDQIAAWTALVTWRRLPPG